MSKKIIIGNWKMNPLTSKEAEKLFSAVAKNISNIRKTEIVICPPVLYIDRLKNLSKKINIGAQDSFWGETGAFTGEVSAHMLYNAGAKYVILGHSERRSLGETSTNVNKKVKESLAAGLIPILCIGERARDESHGYFSVVKAQLEECLSGVSKNSISKVIVMYEPVWAISSTVGRRDATSADCLEMTIFIRKILSDKFGSDSGRMRIIYGGSANEKDAEDFLKNGGIDGLLPGCASLTASKFVDIIKIAENVAK